MSQPLRRPKWQPHVDGLRKDGMGSTSGNSGPRFPRATLKVCPCGNRFKSIHDDCTFCWVNKVGDA